VLPVEAFQTARGHLETLITLTEKPKPKRSPRSRAARASHIPNVDARLLEMIGQNG
jgi:hypothetical protein